MLGEHWFQTESAVFDSMWLPLTGIIVGLLTRNIIGGKAYGVVADMLLGITGAFASAWLTETLALTQPIAWNNRLLFAIWGAVALPALARFFAKHHLLVSRSSYYSRPTNRDSAKL
jgi:uncharacterized membrane protein YeaQ/YmgE (transglycosylase-associated protein family)